MATRRRRHKKSPVRKIVFALLLLGIVGGVLAVLLWHPTERSRRHLIRRSTPQATILYTCDLGGQLTPCTCEEGSLGGIARLATLLDQWTTQHADCIIVDAGNASIHSHDQAETIDRLAYQALDQLGYAVANCGDNEITLPLDRLTALAKPRKLVMVSANVIDASTGNTIFPAYHIVARGDIRTAFIGLVRNDGDPATLGKGLRLLEPADALKAALASLGDKADLVVALAYLPADQIYELARKFPKVNIFLGGQAQASSASHELARRCVVAYLGDRGYAVGRIEAAFPPDTLPVVSGQIRVLDNSIPESEATAELLDAFTKAVREDQRPGAGHDPKLPCTASFVGSEVCKLCHISEFYSWQATPHAGAYVTLLQQNKHEDHQCLACHTTGYAMPDGYRERMDDFAKAEDPEAKRRAKLFLQALKGVGCETCHGGGRRHFVVARDRSAVAKRPYQRAPASARSCLRCHNPQRPCVPEGEADAFQSEEYLGRIKHWP